MLSYSSYNSVPSRSGLTVWSSRHQQAPLVGTLRASHSGAAYRGRYASQQKLDRMEMKKFFFACSMAFAINAYGATKQIEIIGISPGESTEDQVEKIKSEFGYVIGGYELICTTSYIDGTLGNLFCMTGKEAYSRDKTTSENRIATNEEIHSALLKGFTAKFGAPSTDGKQILSNRLGAQFKQHLARWVDKKGNTLTIISIGRTVDEGMLILKSAKQVKLDDEKSKETDQQRKF